MLHNGLLDLLEFFSDAFAAMPVLQRLNLHLFFGLRSLVSFIELIQVKSDTLLNSFNVAFCFLGREVVRFAVYRLELTPVNGNHHIGEHMHLSTQINESPASIFDAFTIVFLKSAMVLKSGANRSGNHINSTLRWAFF